jgi:hypothetical protein
VDEEDLQQQNAERARLGRVAAIRAAAWSGLLAHPDGRRFCYELLERGHIFVTSYRASAMDMAFAEGERNFALQINSDMALASSENYALMLKEASARKEKDNA